MLIQSFSYQHLRTYPYYITKMCYFTEKSWNNKHKRKMQFLGKKQDNTCGLRLGLKKKCVHFAICAACRLKRAEQERRNVISPLTAFRSLYFPLSLFRSRPTVSYCAGQAIACLSPMLPRRQWKMFCTRRNKRMNEKSLDIAWWITRYRFTRCTFPRPLSVQTYRDCSESVSQTTRWNGVPEKSADPERRSQYCLSMARFHRDLPHSFRAPRCLHKRNALRSYSHYHSPGSPERILEPTKATFFPSTWLTYFCSSTGGAAARFAPRLDARNWRKVMENRTV